MPPLPHTPHALRVCAAFWLLGLINNVLYVIILSAALDLVGPSIPKGVVLLADVLPSFIVKLVAPYFIHLVPYGIRVVVFAALSAGGMLLIAFTPATHDGATIAVKLLGVALASLSSGGGELSFLGLTHFYDRLSLASWSSGTGGAGLVGAGAYVLATTTLGMSSQTSLFVFSFLPIIMLLSFFIVLPKPPAPDNSSSSRQSRALLNHEDEDEDEDDGEDSLLEPAGGLRHAADNNNPVPVTPPLVATSSYSSTQKRDFDWSLLQTNLKRAKSLFFPYMLPLLLVYVAEYTINQGVAPTLLFPLFSTPFAHFRDFYPAYSAIYQVGVFISRTFGAFVTIRNLYIPSTLQVVNLAVLTLHALFFFLPNVWILFLIIFWEGLLGGFVYVRTFTEITESVPSEDREFSLSATTVSDSGGICLAAFISMAFETSLCQWQVSHGRDYCRQL